MEKNDLWQQARQKMEEEGFDSPDFETAEYYNLNRILHYNLGKIREAKSELIREIMEKNPAMSAECTVHILSDYSLMDFLYGDCNIFAQYLHKRYKYEMEAVYLDDGFGGKQLIHMYCVSRNEDGRKIYIDCRGKCDSFPALMQEFEDAGLWSSDEPYIIKRYKRMPKAHKTAEEDAWRLHFAKLADESLSWYS